MRLAAPALLNRGVCLLLLIAPRSRGLLSGCNGNLGKGSRNHRHDPCGHPSFEPCGETRARGSPSMHFARSRTLDPSTGPSRYQQIPAGRSRGSRARREEAAGGAVAAAAMASGATAAVPTDGTRAVQSRGGAAGAAKGRRAATVSEDDLVWKAGAAGEEWAGGKAGGVGLSAMQSLRHSVARLPRLSREDERALCQDVQRWRRLEKLREEICQRQGAFADGEDGGRKVGLENWAEAAGMSVADLRELVERGSAARERLVLSHVRLVMYLAGKRGRRTALSSMDLIQEGAIALHLAVEKYDPERGVRFFTYADWSLRAAFEKAEATQSTTIEMPRYLYVQKRRLKAILGRRHGSQTRKDLAASLDISERQVAKLLRWANDCRSMDAVLVPGGATLGEVIPGSQSTEAVLRRLDAEASLVRLLEHLKPQEEQVIVHRYGLFGRGKKSTPAVAAVMGVSRQYVGRVHQIALNKMRASLEQDQQLAFYGTVSRAKRLDELKRSRSAPKKSRGRNWTI